MKAIIGTAGHIDHGKSALITALTGIETDRLPEERERGISIELGFAYLELPDGERAGIVDVPGHERFIRQMLAGAQGFDLVLLVVAADDGVMPQTEEHFEICHLLGVDNGIFVITKTDLVDDGRVDQVREEVEILAAGTELEGADVVAVSAASGEGVEELRARIIDALAGLERADPRGAFRMPIDRAFVLKGYGVIVTGTAAGGSVGAGDELEVAPQGLSVRVRTVQVHGQNVERAWAGQRVALNLVGVELDEIGRGDSVVAPRLGAESLRFDASVEVRPSAGRAIKSHQRVRVYLGTSEAVGKIVWVDGLRAVEPGNGAYGQIVLHEPVVTLAGDRFVLRDETAARTLGGGRVLLSQARKHRSSEGPVAARLEALGQDDLSARLVAFVDMSGSLGVTLDALAVGIGVDVDSACEAASACQSVMLLPDPHTPCLVVSAERYRWYVDGLVTVVAEFHDEHPNLAGIELERLRRSGRYEVEPRLFRTVIDTMVAQQRLLRRGGTVTLPGYRVSMSDDAEALAGRILTALRESPTTPPTLKEVEEIFSVATKSVNEVVGVLIERGEVVRVSRELVFAADVLGDIEQRLRDYLASKGQITAAGFRDLISASRKYSIPLLDHFDRNGVTIRSGDYRRLRAA